MRCLPLIATCAALAVANRLPSQVPPTSAAKRPASQPASIGGWEVSESKSEMTDEHTVALSLRASTPLQGDFGAVWPTLVVRCRENRIEAYVNASMVLNGDIDGDSPVRLRWNEDTPIEATWSRSSDYRAVFADDPAALVAGLSRYSKLRVEIHPYDRTPIVVSFAPKGIDPLISKLSRACPKAGLDTAIARARAVTVSEIPSTTTQRSDQTYFEFQVERQATLMPSNPTPTYPPMLRSANVEGEVLAQFVVDTAGKVDVSTFHILKSTHDLFTQAVKDLLPQLRFSPAEVGSVKVRQLVQMPFPFTR